jgi:hypothetical protein
MKGDQMGIRAAYPTPLELPLSNRTWFSTTVACAFSGVRVVRRLDERAAKPTKQ